MFNFEEVNLDAQSIAQRITLVRGDFSRRSFAAALDIKENTLRNYEKGLSLPNSDIIAKICDTFSVNSEWLIFGRGPMRPVDSPDQPQADPAHPSEAVPQADCPRCSKLEAKLEKVEQQRDVLVEENRKLWEKNSELIAKNGELNTQVTKLEAEAQKPGIYKQDIAQTGVA